MRAHIVKGFLPWIIFFAFADGSLAGLGLGGMLSVACLLSVNFSSLKRGFVLDWCALVFLLVMMFTAFGFRQHEIATYDLLAASAILSLICFFSLLFRKPVTKQYAKLRVSEMYWQNPIFFDTNYWITFIWGVMFLGVYVFALLFYYGMGSKLWMTQIISTGFIVLGIAFTILFPDTYKVHKIKKCGISAIAEISDIEQFKISDMLIGYRIFGKGPLLILANDAYTTMHMWDPDFLKRLSMFFQLLVFDYPGVGYSSSGEAKINIETIAGVLKRLTEKLKLEPKAFLGYGMGGRVAQQFAVECADKKIALILINSDMPGKEAKKGNDKIIKKFSEKMSGKLMHGFSFLFPTEAPDSVEDKLQEVSTSSSLLDGITPKEIFEKQTLMMTAWYEDDKTVEQLSLLNAAVLVITGKKDILVPAENAALFAKKIKKAQFAEYADAGQIGRASCRERV